MSVAAIVRAAVVFCALVAGSVANAQLRPLEPPGATPSVAAIAVGPSADGRLQIALSLSAPVDHEAFALRAPDRLVLDIPGARFALEGRVVDVAGAPGVVQVRYGHFRRDRSRIVLDLAGAPTNVETETRATAAGVDLVLRFDLPGVGRRARAGTPEPSADPVPPAGAAAAGDAVVPAPPLALDAAPDPIASGDIATSTVDAAAPAAQDPSEAPSVADIPNADAAARAPDPTRRLAPERAPDGLSGTDLAPDTAARPRPRPAPLMIAIDPGHGGRDPGAVHGGLRESEIVLAFARRLAQILEQPGRIHVVLIRDADVFVELDQRVERARAVGADLFISIHADAVMRHRDRVLGTSVYTLSNEGSVGLATSLAEEAGVGPQDVESVALDFQRRWMLNASDDLAARMLAALREEGLPVLRWRPHRHDEFRVLMNLDAPSVLVEIGFMTHADDRARLVNEAWRAQAAGALARAVRRWAADAESAPSLARRAASGG